MKKKTNRNIILIVLFVIAALFFAYLVTTGPNRNPHSAAVNKLNNDDINEGSPKKFTDEMDLDDKLIVGMNRIDVEKLIGKPQEIDMFLGRPRYKYSTDIKTKIPGEKLDEIDLIYDEHDHLMSINKSWRK